MLAHVSAVHVATAMRARVQLRGWVGDEDCGGHESVREWVNGVVGRRGIPLCRQEAYRRGIGGGCRD